jgi:hypothetical protein
MREYSEYPGFNAGALGFWGTIDVISDNFLKEISLTDSYIETIPFAGCSSDTTWIRVLDCVPLNLI